jgi:hypothetical protein
MPHKSNPLKEKKLMKKQQSEANSDVIYFQNLLRQAGEFLKKYEKRNKTNARCKRSRSNTTQKEQLGRRVSQGGD